MSIIYRFKKFRLEDGSFTQRPIANIILKNGERQLEFGAILDSGSDITTIPGAVADFLELKIDINESLMVGFRGSGKVNQSKVTLIFKGKQHRQNETLVNVPVAVMQDSDEEDVIIGTNGVFDHFKILFNDSKSITLTRLD